MRVELEITGTYYRPHDAPVRGSRFTVDWERPVDCVDTGKPYLENLPRGRTRLIIEGESVLVERVHSLIAPLVEQIRNEIEGRR